MAIAEYKNEDGSTINANIDPGPNYFVHFRRLNEYCGEFGYDWLRDDYLYEIEQTKKDLYGDDLKYKLSPVIENIKNQNMLKRRYHIFSDESLAYPYFIPWLSMFVNHKEKIGKEVELKLELEDLSGYLSKNKNITLSLECTDGIEVIPSEITFSKNEIKKNTITRPYLDTEGYKKLLETKDKENKDNKIIKITATKPYKEGAITVKDMSDNSIVGQLNLYANDKTYPLKIKIVKVLKKQDLENDRKYISDRIPNIINHLKTQSLTQAMIEPEIEVFDKDFILDVDACINEGILQKEDGEIKTTTNTHSQIVQKYQKQFEYTTQIVDAKDYEEYKEFKEVRRSSEFKDSYYVRMNGEANNGKKEIKTYHQYDGIVVFLTTINYPIGVGGTGDLNPTQENYCLITKNGLNYREDPVGKPTAYNDSVSHEIAHVLGLDHIFSDFINIDTHLKDHNERIESLRENKKKLINYENEIRRIKKDKIGHNYVEHLKLLSENIIISNENIVIYAMQIESYEWFRDYLDRNYCYYFEQGRTDNIMDYAKGNTPFDRRSSFYKWQWEIMEKEILKFHGKKDNQ